MAFTAKKDSGGADTQALETTHDDVTTKSRRLSPMDFMPFVMQCKPRRGGKLVGALEALREDYTVPEHAYIKSSRPQRLAHILAWLAVNYPGVLVPYADLHNGMWKLTKPISAKAKEVKQLRGSASSADKALSKHYGMRIIRGPAVDVRASRIDDFGEDLARHVLKKNNVNYLRAHDKLLATLNMIRYPAKIADAETKRFVHDTNGAMKKLAAEDILKRLAPPESWTVKKSK